MRDLKRLLIKYEHLLKDKELDYLINFEIKTRKFYDTLKIYKCNNIKTAIQKQYPASITTTEPLDLKLRPIITVEADDATQENIENIRALFLLNFPVNDDEQMSATETRDQSESDEVVD